jgi:protein with PEP-CTERM/exosortase system signal
MNKFVTCALLALALTLNAEAKDKDKPDKRDKPAEKVSKKEDKENPVIVVDPIGKDGYRGPVYSVPDTGSTALLLGTAVLVLGIASRRFSVR